MGEDSFEIERILGDAIPKIEVMDIGASPLDGKPRYQEMMLKKLCRVTAFEPNTHYLDKLKEQTKDFDCVFMPYFVGDGNVAELRITYYPGCCSIYEPSSQIIDLFTSMSTTGEGNFAVKEKHKVQTKRLDDIASEFPKPDYIKIDIQGAELDALSNAKEVLKNVLVIEIETEFLKMYENQPVFGDIQLFLQSQGFLFHKFVDMAGRCFAPMYMSSEPNQPIDITNPAFLRDYTTPMSQVLWSDSIFVRDFSRLELYSNEELLKAAVILHDMYHSYDLVSYLLREYDNRTERTAFNAKYLHAMNKGPISPRFISLRFG